MPINQIVIKFKDGSIMKGSTNDFFPKKANFHLNKTDGNIEQINIEDAKAIFFVKDLEGNSDHNYKYNDDAPGGGRKAKVDFSDGETIVGYVLSYSPERQGFIMIPADLSGTNQRIYIVTSSVIKVQFL